MNVWIGTSGYSYTDWVGDFYPAGTKPGGMLAYYAQFFPLVELNFTFYRPPTRSMLLRLADKAPRHFPFLVKVPQSISHERKEHDLAGFRHAVEGLQARGQLLGVLCQFPQAHHCTRSACDWLVRLAADLGHLGLAVEFRHRSWHRPGLPAWLAEHHTDLVAVDVPDLPGLFPRGWVQSGRRAYIRLHSRKAKAWYAGDKERYDYDYTDAQMEEWIAALENEGLPAGTERALLLFNNCQRSQAAFNARRMQQLLADRYPDLDVVPPFNQTAPVQQTLFGETEVTAGRK
jgi:uncharacterized protein YecE (DUF72 family)